MWDLAWGEAPSNEAIDKIELPVEFADYLKDLDLESTSGTTSTGVYSWPLWVIIFLVLASFAACSYCRWRIKINERKHDREVRNQIREAQALKESLLDHHDHVKRRLVS